MNLTIKTYFKAMLFLFLLQGCSITKSSNDQSLYSTSQIGYSPQNPIAIWAPKKKERESKTLEYIKNLRTENGENLEIISKELVPNPGYTEPRIKLYNIFTNEIINKKNGRFIELYTLHSKGKDTIYLYINNHSKDKLRVPPGLEFASN
ncbi:hypothetical protein LZ575_04755 [Antarcticibacterium sp. 1MA-6-2]|uniref:hypothetical protein n=1 Tax=Antarcticibacterium sp. 1MA-6-2 TaxID=2908210 RepID=UPI001F415907|nr:hypothetical protein [Antarcticibacterium sp. 1MA-6-2]UJH91952.1 hypothetical protein LZ575_04755 [Antarcticibacterium sp. 1MA-6-2]